MLLALGPALSEARRQLAPPPPQTRPAFILDTLEGAPVDLATLRGQPVLVHFFATWCEPCRDEFVSLAHLAAERASLKILTINVGEVPARVRRFAEDERIAVPILLDSDRKVTRAWSVTVLPTTLVLDASHAARLMVEGDLDWRRPDVIAAIDSVAAAQPHDTSHKEATKGEIE